MFSLTMVPFCQFVESNCRSCKNLPFVFISLGVGYRRTHLAVSSTRYNPIPVWKLCVVSRLILSPPWFGNFIISPLYMCIFQEVYVALDFTSTPQMVINSSCLSPHTPTALSLLPLTSWYFLFPPLIIIYSISLSKCELTVPCSPLL